MGVVPSIKSHSYSALEGEEEVVRKRSGSVHASVLMPCQHSPNDIGVGSTPLHMSLSTDQLTEAAIQLINRTNRARAGSVAAEKAGAGVWEARAQQQGKG